MGGVKTNQVSFQNVMPFAGNAFMVDALYYRVYKLTFNQSFL